MEEGKKLRKPYEFIAKEERGKYRTGRPWKELVKFQAKRQALVKVQGHPGNAGGSVIKRRNLRQGVWKSPIGWERLTV